MATGDPAGPFVIAPRVGRLYSSQCHRREQLAGSYIMFPCHGILEGDFCHGLRLHQFVTKITFQNPVCPDTLSSSPQAVPADDIGWIQPADPGCYSEHISARTHSCLSPDTISGDPGSTAAPAAAATPLGRCPTAAPGRFGRFNNPPHRQLSGSPKQGVGTVRSTEVRHGSRL